MAFNLSMHFPYVLLCLLLICHNSHNSHEKLSTCSVRQTCGGHDSEHVQFEEIYDQTKSTASVKLPITTLSKPCVLQPRVINQLLSLSILYDYFSLNENSAMLMSTELISKNATYLRLGKQRRLILLLLLLSGNIKPNPGPEVQTPCDFKSLQGLKIIHLNVRSLLPKIDQVRIWVKSTAADVIVISETWLTKSISNNDIHINGFEIYRADRPAKGGGVAIYVNSSLHVNLLQAKSICKQFELLELKIEIAKGLHLNVVGCYRPPSATANALQALKELLCKFNSNETILIGDLNWDWLSSNSDDFKTVCDQLNLTQLITSPTRPNIKCPSKSTLIDLMLTNAPHKYRPTGVFCNDLSDHCIVATVRNTKMDKKKPRVIVKRDLKHFNEQAFNYDLSRCQWNRIELIPDVESAWSFFYDCFMAIVNKHAPFKKFRIKGRDNPWFTPELANALHERNLAWANARKTGLKHDWDIFRQLRNKSSSQTKKAKSEFFFLKYS